MNQNFGFDFIINYSMDTFQLKPPLSYAQLVEISKERFDLKQINGFFFEDEEISIKNDSDYLKLLDFGDKSEMNEIELIIKTNDQKKKRRQSFSRKISNAFKPSMDIIERSGGDDGTINGIINLISYQLLSNDCYLYINFI